MDRVSNPSHDSSLTEVFGGNVREDENNPTNHDFEIRRVNDGKVLETLHFQHGPISEEGVNGILNEDLIIVLINRIDSFQKSKLACRENENALSRLHEALWYLSYYNQSK
jgi:hypothetical protein